MFSKLFFIIFFFFLFSFQASASNTDAIAVRIIQNPEHYSPMVWYKKQGFKGSPQKIIVDGYEGIRDGRTVYVNAANIDTVNNNFYTNIYLISYNQDSKKQTIDIFSQILKHWKFNNNLIDSGLCHNDNSKICNLDSDCENNDYCENPKIRVIRDTKRLSDIQHIKFLLDQYKKKQNDFPSIKSGSYLKYKTISVWPSWFKVLSASLGERLPVDPINKLGPCGNERFNPNTCWDDKAIWGSESGFASNLEIGDPNMLPSGSHVYVYTYDPLNKTANYCSVLETSYDNLSGFTCFQNQSINHPPQIISYNLRGMPNKPFTGYITVKDPDFDNLTWSISPYTPNNYNTWANNYNWVWNNGSNGFVLNYSEIEGLATIEGKSAGLASSPGMYQIELEVSDGKSGGTINQILDIDIGKYEMKMDNVYSSFQIGESGSLNMPGIDNSGNVLHNIHFINATLNREADHQTININTASELSSHGFTLAGNNNILNYDYTANQQIGTYHINVYSLDPTTNERIDAFFEITVNQNIPRFSGALITYSNHNTNSCSQSNSCHYLIDNEENATVNFSAVNNNTITYLLQDNFSNKLNINQHTGLVSGFENLNFHQSTPQTFNITVLARNDFFSNCVNSGFQANECQADFSLEVEVDSYCDLSDPSSDILTYNNPGTFLRTNIPFTEEQKITISSIPNYREISGGLNLHYLGVSDSREILFVLDASDSMSVKMFGDDTTYFDQMKEDLAGGGDSILNLLHNIANSIAVAGNKIYVGLEAFNQGVRCTNCSCAYYGCRRVYDLSLTSHLSSLRNDINSLTTNYQTDILKALNYAEDYWRKFNDDVKPIISKKYLILMSDGQPEVERHSGACCNSNDGCSCSAGTGGGHRGMNTEQDRKIKISNADFKIANTPNTECAPRTPSCSPYYLDSCITPCANHCTDIKCPGIPFTCYSACVEACKRTGACTLYPAQLKTGCGYVYYNCDNSGDVEIQADFLKNVMGVKIYTAYYKTSYVDNSIEMCKWSSEENSHCSPYRPEQYAYTGTDLKQMFQQILSKIFVKPKEININSHLITDDSPYSIDHTIHIGINNPGLPNNITLNSNNKTFAITSAEGEGEVSLSDLNLKYCKPYLHR